MYNTNVKLLFRNKLNLSIKFNLLEKIKGRKKDENKKILYKEFLGNN